MITHHLDGEMKSARRLAMRGELAYLCDPFRVENKVSVGSGTLALGCVV